jgi:hypothetical protein
MAIWAVGWLAVSMWDEHLHMLDGRGKYTPSESDATAKLWLVGAGVFFVIGVFAQ